MFQDKILQFLGASKSWEHVVIDKPLDPYANKFPGTPKDCFLFQRAVNIEDMECEDDEAYIFSTPDYTVRTRFNRFQTREAFTKLGPQFTTERVDMIIKMAWNYPKLVINKVSGVFEPFVDGQKNFVPLPNTGGPPRRTVFIE